MGKRTAAEADVLDHDDAFVTGATAAAPCTSDDRDGSGSDRRVLLESPVPLVWRRIPDRHVEPRGACHTRVRAAPSRATRGKLPLPLVPDDHGANSHDNQSSSDGDAADDDDDNDNEPMTELSMALPPLVAPRPRRVVSPDLIFQSYVHRPVSHSTDAFQTASSVVVTPVDPLPYHDKEHEDATTEQLSHELSLRRRAFRPIGAGRPDVEMTSPPPRAMNPVVLDARFKNMQRLDLQLDARDATLQPFRRPCPQRRVPTTTK